MRLKSKYSIPDGFNGSSVTCMSAYMYAFCLFAGAVLHVHDVSILDVSWLIKNVTYDPHCFMCTQSSGNLLFHFFDKPPSYDGTGSFCSQLVVILFFSAAVAGYQMVSKLHWELAIRQ